LANRSELHLGGLRWKNVFEVSDMAVDRPALQQIGKLMRRHFDELVSDPLPPRLYELVERLKVEAEVAQSPQAKKPGEVPQEPLIGLGFLCKAAT
jgi:hypothetical protein